MRKRGAIQIQFNWIFVLVAGAMILLVFFGFAMRQRAVAQERVAGILVNDIASVASGAGVSRGVAQQVGFKIPVEFTCSDECVCEFAVDKVSREFEDKIIFAPSIVDKGNAIFWALDWKAPFRITNFLFVAHPVKTKYYFVYQEQGNAASKKLKEAIEGVLPEEFNAEYITSVSSADYSKESTVKFIFLNVAPQLSMSYYSDIPQKSLRIIEFKGGDENTAQIILHDLKNGGTVDTVSKSLGLPTLLAAVFSDNGDMYKCNMQHAFRKMNFVNTIYLNRTQTFAEDTSLLLRECSYKEENGVQYLEEIENLTSRLQIGLDATTIGQLQQAIKILSEKNDKKVLESCPRIF